VTGISQSNPSFRKKRKIKTKKKHAAIQFKKIARPIAEPSCGDVVVRVEEDVV
jgi:hypothetical protein